MSVVPINMAGMNKKWLKSVRVMSNVEVFVTQVGGSDTTNYIMFVIWINTLPKVHALAYCSPEHFCVLKPQHRSPGHK